MEELGPNPPGRIKSSGDYIIEELNLVTSDEPEHKGFLKLKSSPRTGGYDTEHQGRAHLDSLEELSNYFEGIDFEGPDQVLRPKGDTTYFTSAGVQRIETILRKEGRLERSRFAVAQPSIRSQFMDKVRDGTSTSFVDFAVISIGSAPDEFIDLSNKFIRMIIDQGASFDELEFQVEDVADRWGDRKFTKTVLTLYFRGSEIGECVYMHDFPGGESGDVAISDICFSIERLNWVLGKKEKYFSEFDNFYEETVDSNKTTSIIDCMRTAVLMAGEGVKPSHHDPGYRLRQLSKRFISRNLGINISATELAHTALAYWEKWGYKLSITEAEVIEILNSENDRSYNVLILSLLEMEGGPRANINVNQTSGRFLEQVKLTLPKEFTSTINNIIERLR